jgi:hypothetical protein
MSIRNNDFLPSSGAAYSRSWELKGAWLKAHGGSDVERAGVDSGLHSIKDLSAAKLSTFVALRASASDNQSKPYAATLALTKIRAEATNTMLLAWLQVLGMPLDDVSKLQQSKFNRLNDIARSEVELVTQSASIDVPDGQRTAAIVLSGSTGDDALDASRDDVAMQGGAGDDWLEAYSRAVLDGGAGNDVLEAYYNANLSGGSGDDSLSSYGGSVLSGGDGNDSLRAYDDSILDGGDGNDMLHAYERSIVDGGDGDDVVGAGDHSTIKGGNGNDSISTGDYTVVEGGNGNDHILAGRGAMVSGGAGDDAVAFAYHATMQFNRGDGHDRLMVASEGATVQLGYGLTLENTTINHNNDKTIKIDFGNGQDSIQVELVPFQSYEQQFLDRQIGSVTLQFADGRSLSVG